VDTEALAALQTAAKLSPGNPQILMALSDYYMSIGRFDDARKHAEAVGDAGTASPHESLARIALAEGDLASAEREARAALERYPRSACLGSSSRACSTTGATAPGRSRSSTRRGARGDRKTPSRSRT
jgi:tetratricopeptide (TPR) repeat protein